MGNRSVKGMSRSNAAPCTSSKAIKSALSRYRFTQHTRKIPGMPTTDTRSRIFGTSIVTTVESEGFLNNWQN